MSDGRWRIHFFQRHERDDPGRAVPSVGFFDGLPDKVVAEMQAVLDAVADAPPPAFSGGGKWEAMHGEMSGFYEVRVQREGRNHRLFCVCWSGTPSISAVRASW
jgi:Txe/YoeB family toxin of Txe-Axe toxin-antitoxin module